MIPIRDILPTRRFPIVNTILIVANSLAFLYEIALGDGAHGLILQAGLVPSELLQGDAPDRYLDVVTSMFLHGGWMHVIGNMWFLNIFGDNVEDVLGRMRYVVFYLFAGVGAALLQVAMSPDSTTPMIGASGAIAGVLGAYIWMFPRARVVTLIPLFIFIEFIELPAFLFIGVWFLLQFVQGLGSMGGASTGGVAWWAHIGGFIAGLLLIFLLRPRDRSLPDPRDHYGKRRRVYYR